MYIWRESLGTRVARGGKLLLRGGRPQGSPSVCNPARMCNTTLISLITLMHRLPTSCVCWKGEKRWSRVVVVFQLGWYSVVTVHGVVVLPCIWLNTGKDKFPVRASYMYFLTRLCGMPVLKGGGGGGRGGRRGIHSLSLAQSGIARST